MKMLRIIVAVLCFLFLAVWNITIAGEIKPMTKEKLLAITKVYLAQNHPSWTESLSLPAVFIDHADYWEVTFELPKGTIGGVPVIQIQKRSYKVTKAYHTQ